MKGNKPRPPKDYRTPAERREQDLRNSAAIRGISYEQMLAETRRPRPLNIPDEDYDEDRPY
jgi:hypothetical protein